MKRVWTTDIPNSPGFYWFRNGFINQEDEIARVWTSVDDELMMDFPGGENAYTPWEWPRGYWCGPIEHPIWGKRLSKKMGNQ